MKFFGTLCHVIIVVGKILIAGFGPIRFLRSDMPHQEAPDSQIWQASLITAIRRFGFFRPIVTGHRDRPLTKKRCLVKILDFGIALDLHYYAEQYTVLG